MGKRREFRFSDHDLIASAQILGWLAYPNAPILGISVLQQWAIRRGRERDAPWALGESPIRMDARNRLQSRIDRLNWLALRRLRAGDWLAKRIAKHSDSRIATPFGLGSRALARREGAPRGAETNTIRQFWDESIPVIHLASAARAAITDAYEKEGRRGLNLERTLFWPDWVPAAIAQCEQRAATAARLGLVNVDQTVWFYRT